MSVDIATLSIVVDSTQVVQATKDLDGLAAASVRAESASTNLALACKASAPNPKRRLAL